MSQTRTRIELQGRLGFLTDFRSLSALVLAIVVLPSGMSCEPNDGDIPPPSPSLEIALVNDPLSQIAVVASDLDTGEKLTVLGEKASDGSVLKVTGGSFIDPTGNTATFWLGDDGLPSQAVDGDLTFFFSNYTANSVDITVVTTAGQTFLNPEVAIDAGILVELRQLALSGDIGQAEVSATMKGAEATAKNHEEWRGWIRAASLSLDLFCCVSSVVGTVPTAGIAAIGVGICCTSALITIVEQETGEEVAPEEIKVGLSVVGCVAGSCGGLALNAIEKEIDEAMQTSERAEEVFCDGDLDGDGVPNCEDKCQDIYDPDQADADGDNIGDACDSSTTLDIDRDGIFAPGDNCPAIFNPDQANADGDDHGDVCDNCKNDPNNNQADIDGDNIGDACDSIVFPDSDGDGVFDADDNCPSNSNASQANADGDQHGDACDNCRNRPNLDQADVDGDRIGDVCDNCPTTRNPGQEDFNNNGIGDACELLNQSPVANAGTDQTQTANEGNSKIIIFNGSLSFDPDGSIISYTWRKNGTHIMSGERPSTSLAVGTHLIELTVTDDEGKSSSDSVTIVVVPRPGPIIGNHLSISNETWDDSVGGDNEKNGRMEAGEILRVKIRLCTSTPVQNIDAILSTADPDIVITDPPVYYDDFGTCKESVGWFDMDLNFALEVGETRNGDFTMRATYKIDSQPYYQDLPFSEIFFGPLPPDPSPPGCDGSLPVRIVGVTWVDEDQPGESNGDDIPQRGEFGEWSVVLENTGLTRTTFTVRVYNLTFGDSVRSSFDFTDPVDLDPGEQGGTGPFRLAGERIPCTFIGNATVDIIIKMEGSAERVECMGYQIFEVEDCCNNFCVGGCTCPF